MSFLKWTWRVILLIVVGCFVATIYYMTHEVDMDAVLPTLNIVGVAGVALLGVIWTAARRYWNALVMLVALGVLRGLFDDELLTEFQSVWVLVSAGFVVFILLVALIARVLREDHARNVAVERATAQTAQAAVSAPPAAGASEPAPVMAKLVPPPVSVLSDTVAASPAAAEQAAAEAATTRIKAAKKAADATDAGDPGDEQPSADAPSRD